MLDRIGKALSSVAQFIGRFWPMSRNEDTLLEELGRSHARGGTSQSEDTPTREPPGR